MTRKPVIIDAEELSTEAPSPAEAPPVPDPGAPPAMVRAVTLSARGPSLWGRLVRWALGGLLALLIGTAAWDFVLGLFARNAVLGWAAVGLAAILLLAALLAILREIAALARLARIEALQARARAAASDADRGLALKLIDDLERLYAGRERLRLGLDDVRRQRDQVLDADALLALAEGRILAPLDAEAAREIEGASRAVAATTALVPLALADVVVALAANVRMIRRIAEIYGGRAGTFGSLRLMRAVATHLLATGAVAVGDDLIGSVAGGGALAKISRRFGEGVVNGALTARVGVAAVEVCRPMPFAAEARPRVTSLVKRALTGLFGGERQDL